MRTKLYIVISILVLSSLLTACATTASAQSSTPTTAAGEEPKQVYRTMTVNGSGIAKLTPDIAYINIGVHAEGSSAADTMTQNNQQTTRVIDALKKFGVAEKDIQTVNFNIYPQPQYGTDGQPTGEIKYVVDNTVYVTVRDLTKLGDLLDTVVKSGANTISGIQFDVADKSQAYSDARKAAVENARLIAEELASAAGVSLGAVQTVNVYSNMPTPVYQAKAVEAPMMADASVPVMAGELTITVEVNVVYEIR